MGLNIMHVFIYGLFYKELFDIVICLSTELPIFIILHILQLQNCFILRKYIFAFVSPSFISANIM